MGQYELKTIYTNYAKELMCNTLKIFEGSEPNMNFKFSRIVISPEVRKVTEDIEDIGTGYTIPLIDKNGNLKEDVSIELRDRVGTSLKELMIRGNIESDVTGIHLGCMGLFVRTQEQEGSRTFEREHLFAVMFGTGYDIKPSNIGYELEITIVFQLQDENIISSRFPDIYVNIKEKTSVTELRKATVTLLYEVENLERCIDYNATKEGMNLPQVEYLRQQAINRNLTEFANTLKLIYYSGSINMNKCKNVFFPINLTSLDDYTVTNYVIDDLWKEGSKLWIEAQTDTFRSDGDEIAFNQPFTLSLFLNLNSLDNTVHTEYGTPEERTTFILCKADTTDNNFTKYYMRFYVESVKVSGATEDDEEEMVHSLVFQIYGNNGSSIINTYTLTNQDVFDIREYYINLVYTFNGDNVVPITQLYWNGIKTDSVQTINGNFNQVLSPLPTSRLMNYEVYGGTNFEYSEGVLLDSIMFFNDVLEQRDLTYMAKINGSQTLPIIEF